MAHRQTKFERLAEGSFPYWIALIEAKCAGAQYEKIREFCAQNGLTLSRFGHSVVWHRSGTKSFGLGARRTPIRS
jgi:hypothetical protein